MAQYYMNPCYKQECVETLNILNSVIKDENTDWQEVAKAINIFTKKTLKGQIEVMVDNHDHVSGLPLTFIVKNPDWDIRITYEEDMCSIHFIKQIVHYTFSKDETQI